MSENSNTLPTLFAACWKDEALKQQFIENPKSVLAEFNVDVPEETTVHVHENSENTIHITMPVAPDNHLDLSDDELENVAGGLKPIAVDIKILDNPN